MLNLYSLPPRASLSETNNTATFNNECSILQTHFKKKSMEFNKDDAFFSIRDASSCSHNPHQFGRATGRPIVNRSAKRQRVPAHERHLAQRLQVPTVQLKYPVQSKQHATAQI